KGNGDSILYVPLIDSTHARYFTSVFYHNNRIITAGFRGNPSSGGALWVCKYDTTGQLLWSREYMNNAIGFAGDANLLLSSDSSSYIVAGDIYDSTTGSRESCVVKIDAAGNLKWVKSLQRPYTISENRIDLVPADGGGY